MGAGIWMYGTFVWIIMTMLGGVLDANFSTSGDNETALNTIIQLKIFEFTELDLWFTEISAPFPNADFFFSIVDLLMWDYEFLKGDLNIIRWFFLILSAGMTFVLVTKITPVFLEVISTLKAFVLGR
tara:strand:+ start:13734 stop:14114 length:381 start_codon:yes stop_codon:yes gene_type:complete